MRYIAQGFKYDYMAVEPIPSQEELQEIWGGGWEVMFKGKEASVFKRDSGLLKGE